MWEDKTCAKRNSDKTEESRWRMEQDLCEAKYHVKKPCVQIPRKEPRLK